MPMTSKKMDGIPGRAGAVSVQTSETSLPSITQIGGELTSKRVYLNRQRLVLTTTEQKKGLRPQDNDKAIRDRTYINSRLNISGLFKAPLTFRENTILKPSRRNAEQLTRRPVLSKITESSLGSTRGLEADQTRKKGIVMESRPLQHNWGRNGRVAQKDNNSRNLKKVELQNRLIPYLEGVNKSRPYLRDFKHTSRNGSKIIPENRTPLLSHEVPSTKPILGIERGAGERTGRRDLEDTVFD